MYVNLRAYPVNMHVITRLVPSNVFVQPDMNSLQTTEIAQVCGNSFQKIESGRCFDFL
jgi:hypothetical protein